MPIMFKLFSLSMKLAYSVHTVASLLSTHSAQVNLVRYNPMKKVISYATFEDQKELFWN